MTFSQAVETAHSRGITDFVHHREVGSLYERANSMRPKLARSLDDTDRREQMLSEMNQKLSQAARLYDQLLTAQVSSPVRAQSPPVQQYPLAYYSYAAPAQQYVPLQPQPYATATSPLSQPVQYNIYGSSTNGPEVVPSTPTPVTLTQSFEHLVSPPSAYSQPVTIPPQYYQRPAQAASLPAQTASYSTSSPTAVPQEVPAAQQALLSPIAPAIASPPSEPPITISQRLRSETIPAAQQPLFLPSFPSVPNDPLPLPSPQHVQPQQPQSEAMLISLD